MFDDFQDGHHGGHFVYRNRMTLANLNLYVAVMPPINFQCSLRFGRCRLKNFKMAAMADGGYQNETILAILNLHVSLMSQSKFRLKLAIWERNCPCSVLIVVPLLYVCSSFPFGTWTEGVR